MLINFVLVLSVLLGCCALALDIGMLELKRLQMQNAADAAALGVVYEFERQKTDYTAAAIAEAGQNGFVNGANNVTVTASVPPTSGIYAGNLAAVQVNISQSVVPIFKSGSYRISASASAVMPPCVYFMSRNPNVTTLTVANSHVKIGCAAYAGWNGTSNSGTVVSFDALYVGGPPSASTFNGTVVSGSVGYYPTFNAPLISDPLSYLVSPTFVGCEHYDTNISTGTNTLSAGTYCGDSRHPGITISGANTVVNFQSGLYVITGGVSWTNATINSSQAAFFLTQGNGAGYGQFNVGSSANVTMTAPTSGPYASVVLFGDRNWSGSTQDVLFTNSNLTIDGIIYMTNTGMAFTNPAGSTSTGILKSENYFGLVVDNFTLSGAQASILGDYSGVSGGSPYRPGVGLAE